MAACHDDEGWRISSLQRLFDLTPCFEEGIVIPAILLILLFSAAWRVTVLYSQEARPRTLKSLWVLRIKSALLVAASLASTANLILLLYSRKSVPVILFYVLEPFALLASLILTIVNHTRTRRSSSILLLFWPVYAIGFLVWARTLISKDIWHLRPVIVLRATVVLFGLISFGLECLAPRDRDEATNESKVNQENPILTSNIFSRWSFGWLTPLLRKGATEYITDNDLPSLLAKDDSANLGRELQMALVNRTSLWTALFLAYGTPFLVAAGLKIIQDGLAFLQPQLLRWLLSYISSYQSARTDFGDSPGNSPTEGIAIVVIMLVASIAQTFLVNQYFQRCFETGMRVRAGLITAIYKKALVLSNDERGGRASGDIVNLMSVDATRLQDLCSYGLMAISGPFQITLAFVSLYKLLGWSAFVGVAILIVSIPLNTFIARILKKMQEKQMKNRDQRTRLMSELLATIKSIKLQSWEQSFISRVLYVRNELEMKMLKRLGIITSLNATLWSGIPLLVAFGSFAVAALTSSTPLTSDVIFPSISVFMLLQFPLAMFAQVTSSIIQALVSVQRLSAFLKADELQTSARQVAKIGDLKRGDEVLSIINGEFSWSQQDVVPTLEGINLTVKKSELLGILGPVGSGKTSLLSAIIGDMTRTDGTVILSGSVSYAPQIPWVMSTTVRDNIIFSHEYDEDFYKLVIDACALGPDIDILPQKDLTQVGEKGITLSGGQRARLSLARAVYARADLVILDDVLAAVDSHVARHVFDHVIGPNGLLSTKARILVTNSISFIHQFDQLAFIRRGIILEQGPPEVLMSNTENELYKLIRGHGSKGSSGTSTPFLTSGTVTPRDNAGGKQTDSPVGTLSEKLRRQSSFHKAVLAKVPSRSPANEITKEHSEQGQVKREVYWRYMEAASKTGFFIYLLTIATQQAMNVLANLTLRDWGEYNRATGGNGEVMGWLCTYAVFSGSQIFFSAASSILIWVYCGLRSARRLHDSMLSSIMVAPLSFFETTPTGRILNLFSRDTYVVDEILPRIIQNLFRTGAVSVSIVLVIGFNFPLFLLAVVPLGLFYRQIMIYYLATSRELKRLDAVSRSPIIAWFSESLAGLSTIRAFQHQSVFIARNEFLIDRNQICYWASFSVNRWLSVRLEVAGAFIVFVAGALALAALFTTGVDAGLVGLVLSYALNTTSSLNWFVRSTSEVEQNIVSVERILHYSSEDMDSEAPQELPDSKPAESWPWLGEVEFRDYSARYRPELDLVLTNISMKIKPKEKIGICGRTGAGKSSILLALFRIIEPASGTILIDGVDITKIGLHDLRSAISIVPQSPDLFEGSLRMNIDPLDQYQDADIWVALGQAHLKEYVDRLPQGLDAPVREGGSSLSAGQRQLLCFARALLRKSTILVLDEATSAVDLDTDKAIQEIIHGPAFANITMFTIAHRLNTIVDSDRVLVLDAGKILELESPAALLSNKDSMFYSLAEEAGLVGAKEK